ncbi:MAG: hypothetical protein WBN23_10585 [Woeseia sp.]
MGLLSRQYCLALSLLLLLAHAALTLHVASHMPVDQTTCEYCAGNTNPAHAPATAVSVLPRITVGTIDVNIAIPLARPARPSLYRERAPPVFV